RVRGGVSAAGGSGAAAGTGAGRLGGGARLGFARRGCGGGSRTSRDLGGAAVALPPDARRRGTMSSGTLDDADLPPTPICSSVSSSSLLVTPSSLANSWTLIRSLAPLRRRLVAYVLPPHRCPSAASARATRTGSPDPPMRTSVGRTPRDPAG